MLLFFRDQGGIHGNEWGLLEENLRMKSLNKNPFIKMKKQIVWLDWMWDILMHLVTHIIYYIVVSQLLEQSINNNWKTSKRAAQQTACSLHFLLQFAYTWFTEHWGWRVARSLSFKRLLPTPTGPRFGIQARETRGEEGRGDRIERGDRC